MPESLVLGEPSPAEPAPPRGAGGVTMLDAAALVTGGAVASVHFRDFEEEINGLGPLGWALLVPAFAWLALTAAGPFVFLVRRFGRRREGYPGPDDRLWLGLGLPWVVTALVRSGLGGLPDGTRVAYAAFLFLGLAAATAPALVRHWRSMPPIEPTAGGKAVAPPRPGPISWTERIGRTVAMTWPIQFALGLAVTR